MKTVCFALDNHVFDMDAWTKYVQDATNILQLHLTQFQGTHSCGQYRNFCWVGLVPETDIDTLLQDLYNVFGNGNVASSRYLLVPPKPDYMYAFISVGDVTPLHKDEPCS